MAIDAPVGPPFSRKRRQAAVFTYLPVLFVSGTVAGVVIGAAAGLLAKRLENIVK